MILLDTHVVLWLISDVEKLSAAAKREIQKSRANGEALAISCITLLETTSLYRKKRIELGMALESFLESLERNFAVLPISVRSCVRTLELPTNYPGDPADRIIGATAMAENLTLITADRNILECLPVQTVW